MPYFLYEGRLECGQEAELIGTEAAHASKSRRLREGEIFEVQDEQPQRFEAKVLENARNRLSFIVENRLEPPPESSLKLELWQALPREKALEMILQKGTELGVSKFVLFPGYFSQGMRHASKQQDALRRWERICREACKQSGRFLFPKLEAFLSLEEALEQKPLQGKGWMLSNTENQNKGFPDSEFSDHGKLQRVLVGPEGGWHQDEMRIAEMSGFQSIILGPRIMRSETAAITAISIIQYLQGDMGTRNPKP